MQEAKEAAESASHNKSQFLANISHEFRTPLNAIIGFSELMIEGHAGPLNTKQSRYTQNILISGKHLLDMINDILDLSKVEAGKFEIQPVWLPVKPLLAEVFQVIDSINRTKNVIIKLDVQDGLVSVYADPMRLKQILVNLLNNAVKFNRPNGNVMLRMSFSEEDGPILICQISDTGVGIPPEKLSHMFQEFYQANTSYTRSHEGTGLGLALTKRLVELHGGRISLESKVNQGTTVTFELPQPK